MIIIIIIKHTNPDSKLRFFPLGFYIRNLGFSCSFSVPRMVQTSKVTWQHKSYTDTLMSISPFHKKSSLEASQELLDCCFCPHVLIIIIIMSRATDNGVQRSIIKSSRGS